MSAMVLRLSEGGRRIYKSRRTGSQVSDSHVSNGCPASESGRKRRVYVDGTQLRRANSAYVERPDRLRADELY
jgi:hypothetical protein